ncbi:MAG: HPF/RaiA family ribosome-associated protein [Candidatus Pacearchaeota archaeon]
MLDKRVSFSGFELEASEQERVNQIIEKYFRKLEEKLKDFQEIKLKLKKSQKGKAFLHEIEGDIIINNKRISSKYEDFNLYKALSNVFEKMLVEIEHIKKKLNP